MADVPQQSTEAQDAQFIIELVGRNDPDINTNFLIDKFTQKHGDTATNNLITHLFLGYGNYKRDGKFYLYPILAKEDLYGYFIPKILKHHNDEKFINNFQTRHDKVNNLIKINNLNSERKPII